MDPLIFLGTTTQANTPFACHLRVQDDEFSTDYYGFAKPGTKSITEPNYFIRRVQTDLASGITTNMYSNGTMERNIAFSNFAEVNYQFLK